MDIDKTKSKWYSLCKRSEIMSKSNIQQFKDILDHILYVWYKEVNDYLENILNAPSTINRLLTHYSVGKKVGNPLEMCIIFHGQVVKVFSLDQDVRQALNVIGVSL